MGVKVEDRKLAQVSMNLTNYEKTPIFRVFDLVKREAARYGVSILESEIVGLVPSAALVASAEYLPAARAVQRESGTRAQAPPPRVGPALMSGVPGSPAALTSGDLLVAPGWGDPEAPHLAVEVAAFDAEHFGGARDIAVLSGQRPEDVIALEAVAGFVQRQRRRPWRIGDGERRSCRETPGRPSRSCRPAP
jgi:hypothetical protein